MLANTGRARVSNSTMAAVSTTSPAPGGGGYNNGNGTATKTASTKTNGSNGTANGGSGVGLLSIGTKPSTIEKAGMKFLIMDAPRQANLHLYIKEMNKNHVKEVVRFCEKTYNGDELTAAGIGLHEMEYADGTSPPTELIMRWLQLVEKTFYSTPSSGGTPQAEGNNTSIAVHCVAGLGRAPVGVAIALIEFANMDPVEAVTFIRARRRGAINEKQLLYLEGYKKQYKRQGNNNADTTCCVIL
jgi:protein tyrosine phosphatase type IVA